MHERSQDNKPVESERQRAGTASCAQAQRRRVSRPPLLALLAAVSIALLLLPVGVMLWVLFRPPPSLDLIRLWADYQLWDRADSGLRRYLRRRPEQAEALMLAARVAAAKGELERCVRLLARVPSSSPLKCAALVRQGQALRRIGYGRRAEEVLRQAVRIADQMGPAGIDMGQTARGELVSLLRLENRIDEATELLWQMYPSHRAKWRLLIAFLRIRSGPIQPDMALGRLERCVELDPSDLDARRAVAEYLIVAGELDRAEAEVRNCLQLSPDDPASLEVLLDCLVRRRKWHEVAKLVQGHTDALASAKALRSVGEWLMETGRLAEAEERLGKSAELDPTEPQTFFLLGRLIRRFRGREEPRRYMNRFKLLSEQREILQRYCRTLVITDPREWQPPSPEQCLDLAQRCAAIGWKKVAREWLRESLRQQPDYQPALQALAELDRTGTLRPPLAKRVPDSHGPAELPRSATMPTPSLPAATAIDDRLPGKQADR